MLFKQFAVSGHIYQEVQGRIEKVATATVQDIESDRNLSLFFDALCLCHTVEVADDESQSGGGGDAYHASSPDELSFVEFAKK